MNKETLSIELMASSVITLIAKHKSKVKQYNGNIIGSVLSWKWLSKYIKTKSLNIFIGELIKYLWVFLAVRFAYFVTVWQ
jgi:hypothetical protein